MVWAQLILKIFIWQMVVGTSLAGSWAYPLKNYSLHLDANGLAIAEVSAEQTGGDAVLGAEPISSELINSLPIAAKKIDLRPRRLNSAEFNLKLTSKNFIVLDVATEAVLAESGADEVRAIGSITKLMTAWVFLKNLPTGEDGWEKVMTVTGEDGEQGHLYLVEGDKVKVRDLFYASLVGSSNNAIMALARSTELPLPEFVRQMNGEAAKMNLSNTILVEPTGLDAGNRSTAKEVAEMLKNILTDERIKEAVSRGFYDLQLADDSGRVIKIKSTDLLLIGEVSHDQSLAIEGAKTGYVQEAGYCFIVKMKNEAGHEVIVAVLGSDSHYTRFSDAEALARWVYKVYLWPGDADYDGLNTTGI